ncbi:DUF3466 family protein [Vibrio splendidus]
MTCTKFKLTTVAALVLAATNANAALYKVVEVDSPVSGNEVHGVAIQDSSNSTLGTLGCFDENATASECEGYLLAGESVNGVEGISHREEVPFGSDNSFFYAQIDDSSDYLRRYCNSYLGFDNCDTDDGWGDQYWNAYQRERNGEPNYKSFVEGSGQIEASNLNTVVNSLDSSGQAIGNTSTSVVQRNQAFPTVTIGGDVSTTPVQSRAWASEGAFTVGSVSTSYTNDNDSTVPFSTYTTKGAIWDGTQTQLLNWNANAKDEEDELLAQGSIRDLTVAPSKIYAVGFNTYDEQHMNATVFHSSGNTLPTSWSSAVIQGAQVEIGGDDIHANSKATSINSHLNILGEAKHYNNAVADNGAFPDKIFVATYTGDGNGNDTWSSAQYLNDSSQSIFFKGAGGKAGAINNYNEIVGQIDSETIRESNGRERRHRGFIYPYQATGTEDSRIALFESKAWWLDDLTNDGNADGNNNKFRVIDATDINDAGVISGTAIRCTVNGVPQPYDTTSHNSYCGNAGDGATEEIVAVKLIPISDKNTRSIQTRGIDSEKIDRQGGSLGWLGLSVLGLLGFRRKFK